jgi:hypothetical protein
VPADDIDPKALPEQAAELVGRHADTPQDPRQRANRQLAM